MSERIYIPIHISADGSTAFNVSMSLGRKVQLIGVLLSDYAGVAAHGSNHITFAVSGSDESTAVWTYSTASAAQGAITAKDIIGVAPDGQTVTVARSLLSVAGSLFVYDPTQAMIVACANGGSGQAKNAVVTLIFKPVS